MKNYQNFCEIFYASHYLPIAMYEGEHFVCASGFYEEGDPYPFVFSKMTGYKSPSVTGNLPLLVGAKLPKPLIDRTIPVRLRPANQRYFSC